MLFLYSGFLHAFRTFCPSLEIDLGGTRPAGLEEGGRRPPIRRDRIVLRFPVPQALMIDAGAGVGAGGIAGSPGKDRRERVEGGDQTMGSKVAIQTHPGGRRRGRSPLVGEGPVGRGGASNESPWFSFGLVICIARGYLYLSVFCVRRSPRLTWATLKPTRLPVGSSYPSYRDAYK